VCLHGVNRNNFRFYLFTEIIKLGGGGGGGEKKEKGEKKGEKRRVFNIVL